MKRCLKNKWSGISFPRKKDIIPCPCYEEQLKPQDVILKQNKQQKKT